MPDLHRGSLRSRGESGRLQERRPALRKAPDHRRHRPPGQRTADRHAGRQQRRNQILLAPVVFTGRIREKVDERRERLYGIPAVPEGVFSNTVIRRSRKNPSANAVLFEGDIPYEPWMAGGQIVLYRDLEDVPDTGRPFRR